MNVLVAGSAGFIGFSLSKRLLDLKHNVIGLDNLNGIEQNNVKKRRHEILSEMGGFNFIKLSKQDPAITQELAGEKIDYVVDLASVDQYYSSYHNKQTFDYSQFVETNVLGTTRLYECCAKLGIKKYIYGSNFSVYGHAKKEVVTETNTVAKPVTPNGASKLAGENVVSFLSRYHNIPTVILRFFTVYGPFLGPNLVVYHLIEKLYNKREVKLYASSKTIRDFLYVSDAVNFITASFNKRIKLQIINAGSGEGHSLEELVNMVAKKLKLNQKDVVIEESETRNFSHILNRQSIAGLTKATKILGYKPQIGIEEGIANTVEWYLKEKQFNHEYH